MANNKKPSRLNRLRKIILEDIDDEVTYALTGGEVLNEQMMVEWLVEFEKNVRPQNTAISAFLSIPGLRAYWPCSSIDQAGNLYDLSGQARTLTGNNSPDIGLKNGMSYISLNGVDQYLSRADEDGLESSDQITLGGWFLKHDSAGSVLMHKWSNLADDKVYLLNTDVWGSIQLGINDNGTIVQTAYSSGTFYPLVTGQWNFIVGRYQSGIQQILVNGIQLETTGTAATVSLEPGAGAFQVGRYLTTCFEIDAAHMFIASKYLNDDRIYNLWYVTRSIFAND